MDLVGFDTATPRVSVAVARDGVVIAELDLPPGRRHAEDLAPAIADLCRCSDVTMGGLSAIAAGTGPGLFTGLRVGITTARVLAQALRIPVVGVATLDLVAYPLRHSGRVIVPVLDARRHEVFFAKYRGVPGGLQRISDYAVSRPDELASDLAATGDEVLLAGEPALLDRCGLDDLEHVETGGAMAAGPRAGALVELATAAVVREEFCAPNELTPMYLRLSDAEIAWDHRRVEPRG
ncbi:MAG TPA: tRNA (adenosine(37)-N6)-threonylcarbamoyltransferase complex dimerization subunit type 1 TsaB [Acidimicrobiia bacterium]|nr:tRNA (adenosine(37)-N6)-threonylcarbamoyltransferase complex dimerization subunit type 1 TsaB [Acidimicrobiia bacterium]